MDDNVQKAIDKIVDGITTISLAGIGGIVGLEHLQTVNNIIELVSNAVSLLG